MIRSREVMLLVLGAVITAFAPACRSCEDRPRVSEATARRETARERNRSALRAADGGRHQGREERLAASTVSPPVTRERVARAIERAALRIGRLKLRGDQGWLVGQGSRLLGPAYLAWARRLQATDDVVRAASKDPRKADQALEGAMWKGRFRPGKPLPPLGVPEVEPVERVPLRFEMEEAPRIVSLMRFALTCSRKTARDGAWRAMVEEAAKGYRLTHQLLALVMAHERGCLDPDEVERYRGRLAGRVLAEQLAEGHAIHDLSVERMAVLCHAGLCDWLPEQDFRSLLDEQQDDGFWGSRGPQNMKDMDWGAHTAALAFYALARRWADTRRQSEGKSPAGRLRAPAEPPDGG